VTDLPDEEAIVVEYSAYIAACVELQEFFRRHRSDFAASPNEAGFIVLWTIPRSYRTFRVVVSLCKAGYGQQAAKLNRTLFEDMLAAHWAMRHDDMAGKRMTEHDHYTATLRKEQYEKHGIPHREPISLRSFTDEERKRLDVRYRGGSRPWTGKSIPQMVRAVAPMWEERDRRLLVQMHDIAHAANNTLLHHSATSLSQGVEVSDDGGVTFNVGPSANFIAAALGLAFWTFANTFSLALQGDGLTELNDLVTKHRDVYSVDRVLQSDEDGP
jgi:Family of unknown function (DUF5677)